MLSRYASVAESMMGDCTVQPFLHTKGALSKAWRQLTTPSIATAPIVTIQSIRRRDARLISAAFCMDPPSFLGSCGKFACGEFPDELFHHPGRHQLWTGHACGFVIGVACDQTPVDHDAIPVGFAELQERIHAAAFRRPLEVGHCPALVSFHPIRIPQHVGRAPQHRSWIGGIKQRSWNAPLSGRQLKPLSGGCIVIRRQFPALLHPRGISDCVRVCVRVDFVKAFPELQIERVARYRITPARRHLQALDDFGRVAGRRNSELLHDIGTARQTP